MRTRCERHIRRPLPALAPAFAVPYAVPLSAQLGEPVAYTVTELVVGEASAADHRVRLAITPYRKEFVRTHWLDLCAVVPPLADVRVAGRGLGGAGLAHRNIKTPGDAVCWSFTGMTTVGHGDHAPTTASGECSPRA
ncbi:ion channel [Streptomyces sp. NPDC004680]|uniref:ion channel n=1 Tax=Streptomyces sp. NPDC004680 TaxID=3154287 RepID=UPI0033BDE282